MDKLYTVTYKSTKLLDNTTNIGVLFVPISTNETDLEELLAKVEIEIENRIGDNQEVFVRLINVLDQTTMTSLQIPEDRYT